MPRKKGDRIDTETQLQVLALIARGDTYGQVTDATGVKASTIEGIKKRNLATLDIMRNKLMDHQVSTSKKILSKAQGLIEKKLDHAIKSEQELEDATQRFRAQEIDYAEYQQEVFGLAKVTLAELNSVSREAFNQSQIEQGKPTSISASSLEAKEDLMRLVDELKKEHNEEELLKLVFDRELIEGEAS